MGSDSFDGAHAFCDWMSIMESCKQVGVDPISVNGQQFFMNYDPP